MRPGEHFIRRLASPHRPRLPQHPRVHTRVAQTIFVGEWPIQVGCGCIACHTNKHALVADALRIHTNKHALLGRWKFLYDLVCKKKLVAALTSFVADTPFLGAHFPPSAMLRHADSMQATILAFEMCNGVNFDDSAQSVNMPVVSASPL